MVLSFTGISGMQTRDAALFVAIVFAGVAIPKPLVRAPALTHRSAVAAPVHADANDQRTAAGRIVDGELRVELDLVEATWSPRGPQGPFIPMTVFAERGHTPQMPGPLLRLQTGTPVRVSVRNTLATSVQIRGLGDRSRSDTASGAPVAFMGINPLVLAPGEEREVKFTPTTAVTSFYFA